MSKQTSVTNVKEINMKPSLRSSLLNLLTFLAVVMNFPSFAANITNCSNCSNQAEIHRQKPSEQSNFEYLLKDGEVLLFPIQDEAEFRRVIINTINENISGATVETPKSSGDFLLVEFCGITCLDKFILRLEIESKDGTVVEKNSEFYGKQLSGFTFTFRKAGGSAWFSGPKKQKKLKNALLASLSSLASPVIVDVEKRRAVSKPDNTGSGLLISRLGHVLTNQHVINDCEAITIGKHIDKQHKVRLLETDRENDLALLRIINEDATKELTGAQNHLDGVPLASTGLMRGYDVKGGEDIMVAGYPFGVMFSSSMKVTKGIVSSTTGFADNSRRFQIDAASQPGNSGGPVYDQYGNIVGILVGGLNKLNVARQSGALPENVNFAIKASTINGFLSKSGVISASSKKSNKLSNEELFEIGSKQAVIVVCKSNS